MATRPKLTNRPTSKSQQIPLHFAPTTLLSASVSLAGIHPITLGPEAVIEFRTRLVSTHGPICVGEGSIVSERASIGLLTPRATANPNHNSGVALGRHVFVESGAIVEAASIGDYTVVEVGAKIGQGAKVGVKCKICAKVDIRPNEVVADNTVVFGNGWGERRALKGRKGLDLMRKE